MTDLLQELRDRLALRALVEAYAHHADRKDAEALGALFTEGGRLAVFDGEPGASPPRAERIGRAAITEAMRGLNRYAATTHFLGQQTLAFDGDRVNGETYCLAHHVTESGGTRSLWVMSIRYLDRYAREAGQWRFEDRTLAVDWTETRPLA